MSKILAWHFVRPNRLLMDGNESVPGYIYDVEPQELKLCVYGLHASERAIDALYYAPGPIIERVELSGRILRHSDKLCAQRREVLWQADAAETLKAFSRWCALRVIDLWNAPEIVKRWLETGDEKLRSEARKAAATAAAAAWATGAARAAAQPRAALVAGPRAAWKARPAEKQKQNAKLEEMLMALEPKGGQS